MVSSSQASKETSFNWKAPPAFTELQNAVRNTGQELRDPTRYDSSKPHKQMLNSSYYRKETNMQTKSAVIGSWFMTAQSVYAFVVSLFWIFLTDTMFVSIFAGYTGQTLPDALASQSKPAELWLITQRLVGFELFPISLLMIFITRKGYNKGEKWAWYALLIAGLVMWGSLIGYKVVTGYFDPTPSSMTFIIGAILFIIGISLPARAILGQRSE